MIKHENKFKQPFKLYKNSECEKCGTYEDLKAYRTKALGDIILCEKCFQFFYKKFTKLSKD